RLSRNLPSRSESVAVVGWRDTSVPVKRTPERLARAETTAPRDRLHRVVALGERPLRGLDPHPFDVRGWRRTDLGGELPLEVPRAETRAAGQLDETVLRARVSMDRRHHRADRVRTRLARPQRHAEL